jgi:transposase
VPTFAVIKATETEKDDRMKHTMIGVDLAKRVFHLHVASMTGEVRDRKKLTPDQFRCYMSDAPESVVVFEACGSVHYW